MSLQGWLACALLIQIGGGFSLSFANEPLLIRARSQFSHFRTQKHYRLPNARVAWVDFDRIRADFAPLQNFSARQVEDWILDQFAYMSETELLLRGIRVSDFPVDTTRSREFFHPASYHRAAVAEAELNGDHLGLVDLKGSGHSDLDRVEEQIRKFRAAPDDSARNAIRVKDHSDGVASFGEVNAEVTRQRAIQATYDLRNLPFETVENYFIIDTGFDILKGRGEKIPSAIIGRQAHLRGLASNAGTDGVYTDDYGKFQRSVSGASVDYGGVIPIAPEVAYAFRPREGGDPRNPDDSLAWSEGHREAEEFRRRSADDLLGARTQLHAHIDGMLGDTAIAWREVRFSRSPYSQVDAWRLALTKKLIQGYFSAPGIAESPEFRAVLVERLQDDFQFEQTLRAAARAGIADPEFYRFVILERGMPAVRMRKIRAASLFESQALRRAQLPRNPESLRVLLDLHIAVPEALDAAEELRRLGAAAFPEFIQWIETHLEAHPKSSELERTIQIVEELHLDSARIRERLAMSIRLRARGSPLAEKVLRQLPPASRDQCAYWSREAVAVSGSVR